MHFKMLAIWRHRHGIKNPFHTPCMAMRLPNPSRPFSQRFLDRSKMLDRACDHRQILPFCTRKTTYFSAFSKAQRGASLLNASFNAFHSETTFPFIPSFQIHKHCSPHFKGKRNRLQKQPFLPILQMLTSRWHSVSTASASLLAAHYILAPKHMYNAMQELISYAKVSKRLQSQVDDMLNRQNAAKSSSKINATYFQNFVSTRCRPDSMEAVDTKSRISHDLTGGIERKQSI